MKARACDDQLASDHHLGQLPIMCAPASFLFPFLLVYFFHRLLDISESDLHVHAHARGDDEHVYLREQKKRHVKEQKAARGGC